MPHAMMVRRRKMERIMVLRRGRKTGPDRRKALRTSFGVEAEADAPPSCDGVDGQTVGQRIEYIEERYSSSPRFGGKGPASSLVAWSNGGGEASPKSNLDLGDDEDDDDMVSVRKERKM